MRDYPCARLEDVLLKRFGDEAVLFSLDKGMPYVLNSTALKVFSLCDGTRSVEDITRSLSEGYSVTLRDITSGISDILGAFHKRGLISYKGGT
jgi:hypothetical protein